MKIFGNEDQRWLRDFIHRGAFLVLGGEHARKLSERLITALANVENSIRPHYASLGERASNPSTHWIMHLVLGIFVRVSHAVCLLFALIFISLVFYRRALRTVVRSMF